MTLGVYVVMSDIHGNNDALRAVEKDVRQVIQAERLSEPTFLCLGDVVDYGPQPQECIERLRRLNPKIWLKGNHDDDVSKEGKPTRLPRDLWSMTLWTRQALSNSQRRELRAFPESAFCDNGLSGFNLFHSTPRNDDVYVEDPGNAAATFEILSGQRCRYGFFGHTHFQMMFIKNGDRVRPIFARHENGATVDDQWGVNQWHSLPTSPVLINPGSVGQPRCHTAQSHADPRPAYLLLHTQEDHRRFQWRRVSEKYYRPERTANLLRSVRWPTTPVAFQPAAGQDIFYDDPPQNPGQEWPWLNEIERLLIQKELENLVKELAEVLLRGR